tara:strand:- start:43 stop:813 length:771 start_codon:yes stop_codon:yes gene_type:complete
MKSTWLDILEEGNIDPYDWKHVSPQVHRKYFHKLGLQPKNYIPIYSLSERNRKLFFRDNIWPFRNGIGRCVLIDGVMSVKNDYNYHKSADIECFESNHSSTVNIYRNKTEREFLHLAFNSGVFNELLKTKKIYLGTSGKLYVESKAKYYEKINLETVQFELDWSIESKDTIALIEAKLPPKGFTNNFILFQAFYPVLYTSLINQKKKIRFFFLDIIKLNTSVDYHFLEINYETPCDLLSYENKPKNSTTIRLIKNI